MLDRTQCKKESKRLKQKLSVRGTKKISLYSVPEGPLHTHNLISPYLFIYLFYVVPPWALGPLALILGHNVSCNLLSFI